ncbi:hypothetical protein F4809DRAFT_640831 [Biscogniauxia mediterranea]|nr:hypothetical protein F4809DRAFT_640831 [Biscogniauxia mediterranea]
MKYSVTTIVAVVAAVAGRLVPATPVPGEPGLEIVSAQESNDLVKGLEYQGLTFGPMRWTGQIDDSGDNYTFYGSFRDVESQARKINPDFKFGSRNSSSYLRDALKVKHNPMRDGYVNCHTTNGVASTANIREMIDWQWAEHGECALAGRKCAQVQCEKNGMDAEWITWCNLRYYTYYTSCSSFAWGASWVVRECAEYDDGSGHRPWVKGVHFPGGNRRDNDYKTLVGSSSVCRIWSHPWERRRDGVLVEVGDGDGGR